MFICISSASSSTSQPGFRKFSDCRLEGQPIQALRFCPLNMPAWRLRAGQNCLRKSGSAVLRSRGRGAVRACAPLRQPSRPDCPHGPCRSPLSPSGPCLHVPASSTPLTHSVVGGTNCSSFSLPTSCIKVGPRYLAASKLTATGDPNCRSISSTTSYTAVGLQYLGYQADNCR